jgi:hypothetical protein
MYDRTLPTANDPLGLGFTFMMTIFYYAAFVHYLLRIIVGKKTCTPVLQLAHFAEWAIRKSKLRVVR